MQLTWKILLPNLAANSCETSVVAESAAVVVEPLTLGYFVGIALGVSVQGDKLGLGLAVAILRSLSIFFAFVELEVEVQVFQFNHLVLTRCDERVYTISNLCAEYWSISARLQHSCSVTYHPEA